MQQTSIKTYLEDVLPSISTRQEAVLYALRRLGPSTNEEINAYLESKINRITPRTKELRDKGLVCEWGKRKCGITGRTAIAWMLNDKEEQLHLI